ncbi:MAG: hypothetical protein A2Z29_06785 [Chloroflexi bacterium RBG_16_56_11]|nr:MAG: hypothetical protein A2Z29_06785 [Chloroflexi bacterium RBG_16_56_11]
MEKERKKKGANAARTGACEPGDTDGVEHALDKLVRELRCLYDIASITTTPHTTLEEKLTEIVNLLPRAMQHPHIAFACISLGADKYKSTNYSENGPNLRSMIFVHGDERGTVEVGYAGETIAAGNRLFSKEEKLLLDSVSERLGEIVEHNLAEAALKESEEKFSRAFNASPDVMTITTLDEGRIIEVNEKYTQATGYGRNDVIGRNSIEIGNWLSEEDRQKVVQKLKEQGRLRDLEIEVRIKTGETRLGQLSAELIELGGKTCVLAVIKDVTEQKQSRELLRTISQSSPLGIYIIRNDRLKYTNPQFQKITGFGQEELVDRDLLGLVALEDVDVVKSSMVYTIRENNPYPCEYRILSRTGQIKWVMQTIAAIHYEGEAAILGYIMDITERKYLERKVIEYEELSKMKSDLLATVSHELRTPLATIKGYATMILDYDTKLSRRESRDYLKTIDSATDRLAKLVDNLLETSRLEAGLLKLDRTETSVAQLIRGIAAEARVRAGQHRILTELEPGLPRVTIDAKRIRQVLDNLIDNGAKYSPSGTEIKLSAKRAGGELLISVADRGPGIPAEELKNIFDRMYRIEQRLYSGVEGIGLGLYICQRLVEAHGGRIWAESVPGQGSTIKFVLPLSGRARKTRPAAGQAG